MLRSILHGQQQALCSTCIGACMNRQHATIHRHQRLAAHVAHPGV